MKFSLGGMPNIFFILTFLLLMTIFFSRKKTDHDRLLIVKIKTRSRVKFFKDEVDEIDLQFNKKDGVGNGDKKKEDDSD